MIAHDVIAITEELASVPRFLKEALGSVAATDLDRHIDGVEFSLRQQLCHLRDTELEGYLVRIVRIAAETEPLLIDLNGSELARIRRYERQDPELAISDFASLRALTVAKLRKLPPDAWARTGLFAPDSPFDVHELTAMMLAHDVQHCDEISALVAAAAKDR